MSPRPLDVLDGVIERLCVELNLDFHINHMIGGPEGLRLRSSRGLPQEITGRVATMRLGEGVCGTVARDTKRMIIPDVQANDDPRLDLLRSVGVRGYACYPLLAEGRLLGTLGMGSRASAGFDEDEIELMQIVCGQIAMALERARLTTELQRRTEELEGAVATSEVTLLQLEAVVKSITEGIIVTDLKGNVLAMNPAAFEMLGFDDVGDCSRHFDNYLEIFQAHYLDSEVVPVEEWPVQRISRGESFMNVEVNVRRLDTGKSWIGSFSGAPVRNKSGEIMLAAITMRDITEQKANQRELKEAKRAAESANRAKDQFLELLSHELRIPLTPVLTLAHILESDDGLPEHLRHYAETIRRNVETEVLLIDDLVDLTRLDKGKLQLDRRRVNLHSLVTRVQNFCRADVTAHRVELSGELAAAHHYINADPIRIQQAFRAIVKSLIRLVGGAGRMIIRSVNNAPGTVTLNIIISGERVHPGLIPHILDALTEGDAMSQRYGGLGLSLAVGRALIEAHGGTFGPARHTNNGESGLEIVLTTSDLAEATAEDVPETTPALENLRVLVVEDHEDTRLVLQSLLERDGFTVFTANSVATALDVARGNPPDLLISDIGLPDGSGSDLMRLLRNRHPLKGIAISGYGTDADIRRNMESGFSEHLTKPVSYLRLHDAIERLI
ncbi:MAG: response regulator [Candidatus Kapaibacterium sp.]